MKKLLVVSIAFTALVFVSCGDHTDATTTKTDTAVAGPDSAANNGVLPPSASPNNANNPSLADTTYHAKDSTK